MKLIKRTYLSTLKWILPALILGSIYCYFMIEYVEHEETDEFLTYEMERLMTYHDEYGNLPEFHKVADIIEGEYHPIPLFKDTLMLEPGDNEMVPYRELRFSINHKGKDFTIVLRHLLLGRDDMFEGTLIIVSGLLIIFVFFVILALRNITGKIWFPFYKTLDRLLTYKLSEQIPEFPSSQITEFAQLNNVVTTLLNKISQDYQTNKEYNENISHELQTQLAIIRVNTEKILNSKNYETDSLKELQVIYNSVNKLSQIQKSLSLLNKIENGEFKNVLSVDIKEILRLSLHGFTEVIDLRKIKIVSSLESCWVNMDIGLTEIMINNLIKNAVIHNIERGVIDIRLTGHMLIIKNTGTMYEGNANELVNRFSKGEGSTGSGIGLAIILQICNIYGFNFSYSISKEAIHTISISFS